MSGSGKRDYIVAIDPGPTESAWCFYEPETGFVIAKKEPNADVLDALRRGQWDAGRAELAVEMIASYGMPVGRETFETCVWIGRFVQAWQAWGGPYRLIYRLECKLHICHNGQAKDPHIAQALRDRFGGKGTKKAPGKLYGFSGSDMYSALAVAVTAAETQGEVTLAGATGGPTG